MLRRQLPVLHDRPPREHCSIIGRNGSESKIGNRVSHDVRSSFHLLLLFTLARDAWHEGALFRGPLEKPQLNSKSARDIVF